MLFSVIKRELLRKNLYFIYNIRVESSTTVLLLLHWTERLQFFFFVVTIRSTRTYLWPFEHTWDMRTGRGNARSSVISLLLSVVSRDKNSHENTADSSSYPVVATQCVHGHVANGTRRIMFVLGPRPLLVDNNILYQIYNMA